MWINVRHNICKQEKKRELKTIITFYVIFVSGFMSISACCSYLVGRSTLQVFLFFASPRDRTINSWITSLILWPNQVCSFSLKIFYTYKTRNVSIGHGCSFFSIFYHKKIFGRTSSNLNDPSVTYNGGIKTYFS